MTLKIIFLTFQIKFKEIYSKNSLININVIAIDKKSS